MNTRPNFSALFAASPYPYLPIDTAFVIIGANSAYLSATGRTAEDIVGKNIVDAGGHGVRRALLERHAQPRLRRSRRGRLREPERQLRRMNICQAWMEVRTHRSLDGGIAIFFRDITERKAAQEQLKLADQRKDEFLAMLAHEVRNPLAPIGAAAQLLQMARLDDKQVRHTSQSIGRQVDHMTHLINDLLDMSRVTRGLVTLENAPQDIQRVVAHPRRRRQHRRRRHAGDAAGSLGARSGGRIRRPGRAGAGLQKYYWYQWHTLRISQFQHKIRC